MKSGQPPDPDSQRQRMRWLLTLPSFAAALFTLALAAYLLLNTYGARKTMDASLEQDLLWQQQSLQMRMHDLSYQLDSLANSLASQGLGSADFTARILALMQSSPEIVALEYIDETGQERWRTPLNLPANVDFRHRNLVALRNAVLINDDNRFSSLILDEATRPLIGLGVPVHLNFNGRHVLIAVIDLHQLLQQQVPWWIAQRYQITLSNQGQRITGKFDRNLDPARYSRSIGLDLPPNRLTLTATVYVQKEDWWQKALPPVVAGLSILMLLATWALRRHIAERQQAEAQLREETAMRMAMENSLTTGIRVMDREGRLSYVNRALCEMVGFSQQELAGCTHPMPYWPPEDMDRCSAVYRAILSGKAENGGYQMRFMRKNGERFDVRLNVTRLIDGEGRHTGWISAIYDITELTREREALQASHERFVAVLNGLDAAVSVSDATTGEMLLSNRQFDRAFDIPDWHGRYCCIPFVKRRHGAPVEAEWYDPYRQHWHQIKSRSSVWVDGSEVWLEIATDITELKLAQERERLQNEQLQQTTRLISMGEMASSLAHELNQPLAAISSYATGCRNILAQKEPNVGQLDQAIEKMAAQAKRAGQIIRGIREFVQRRAPHRRPYDIAQLLDTVQTLLTAELAKWQVILTINNPGDLPPVYVDAVMLEQVIFNLMKNAVEAMHNTPAPQRALTITLAREEEQLSVTIADRGSGIDENEMEQLFKPFYTTKSSGMGMGLNICRSIIEHHQGRLWVESNPGGGTRFVFTLPLSVESSAYEP